MYARGGAGRSRGEGSWSRNGQCSDDASSHVMLGAPLDAQQDCTSQRTALIHVTLQYAKGSTSMCKGPKPCTGTKIGKGELRCVPIPPLTPEECSLTLLMQVRNGHPVPGQGLVRLATLGMRYVSHHRGLQAGRDEA